MWGSPVICAGWSADCFLDSVQELKGPGDRELWEGSEGSEGPEGSEEEHLSLTLIGAIRQPVLGPCPRKYYLLQRKSDGYNAVFSVLRAHVLEWVRLGLISAQPRLGHVESPFGAFSFFIYKVGMMGPITSGCFENYIYKVCNGPSVGSGIC